MLFLWLYMDVGVGIYFLCFLCSLLRSKLVIIINSINVREMFKLMSMIKISGSGELFLLKKLLCLVKMWEMVLVMLLWLLVRVYGWKF